MIVTRHAIERYAEHVERHCGVHLSLRRAEEEIREALSAPLFYCRAARGDLLLGLRNRYWTFIAACRGDGTVLEVTTVGPCWYWHEARPHYRRLMASRRRWNKHATS